MPKQFVTNAGEALIRPVGAAGTPEGAEPKTMFEVFQKTVGKHGSKPALNQEKDGKWKTWTWQQYYNECMGFAKSLVKIGFKPSQSVNIIGFNSPEWFFADVGCIMAGGIAAGIYTTNSPEACHYVANHSDAAVVVCQDNKQLAKFIEIQDRLPKLKALVVYDDVPPEGTERNKVPVYKYADFVALGKELNDEEVEARMRAQTPGNCSTLIYTSGTTGPPKAVMISHDNITWTASATCSFLNVGADDHLVSFLPLSHIAAQMLDIHSPMATGAQVHFARPDALKGTLGSTLKAVRPTIFFGVPRVWEKIAEKMWAIGRANKGLKKKIGAWAKGKGTEWSNNQMIHASGEAPSCFGCAHKVVLSKVKLALGLDRCKACFTGAAPISHEILTYFASLSLPIYELYGMSENTGPQTVNLPGLWENNKWVGRWKLGTVGPALPGCEMKIAAETGEICFRGRHVFMGYMKMADKTRETIDGEGWLHSGDVGKIDADGFLSITGRIKELIITAGGENVPPVLIEENMKTEMKALANAMVVGDKRKYLIMLVTLKTEQTADGGPTNKLTGDALLAAQTIGSTATTVDQAASCAKFKAYFDAGVKAGNALTTSRAQIVQKWVLLPEDFSVPGGELTPTLKLKRKVVSQKYADLVEQTYA